MADNKSKGGKYPWSYIDFLPRMDLPPRERIQVWIDAARTLLDDPNVPNISVTSEAEGNLHIQSLRLSDPSSPPNSPACTGLVLGFKVPASFVNVSGSLSGAHASHLLDRASFHLLCGAAKPDLWDKMAVSTSMNVFWRKPVFLGDEVTIEAEIESFDKSTCSLGDAMLFPLLMF